MMGKTVKQVRDILEQLREKCGDDLVYSFSLMEDSLYLTISSHKSEERAFKHDKISGIIEDKDLDRPIEEIIEETIAYIEQHVMSRDEYQEWMQSQVDQQLNKLQNDYHHDKDRHKEKSKCY